ncbi:lysosomal-associated transmembrane protein 5 [Alligator mississippiensis]|uniref:Lysosomal-associated transmembrane protein 5 n=1 Tax=Alligator mississippiensis TaxID=8496 RepID=A0A151PGU1_ALLMI|nr:lysosomal-associated transmembrane protein 5 [Alligator mississippiensis]KYO48114.1 lysosomal-associated transmembrane protein 5 [Alligator mississippiensis]
MSPQISPETPKCCCFNIKTATVALGIYHVVMSLLLLIEYSMEVAIGRGFCKDLTKDYYKVADITTSFLLIIMLFVISLNLLFGVVKNRERLLVPFMALQIMDFLLSFLTIFSSYIQVPAILSVSHMSLKQGQTKVPFHAMQLLDFCLSVLTLCSSYMEVPAYLSFKSMNNSSFLPSHEKLSSEEYVKVMIIFSIAFIAVLLLKAFMFKCVWRCYKYIKASKRQEMKFAPEFAAKVVLPSYDEALEMPSKESPPPYSGV